MVFFSTICDVFLPKKNDLILEHLRGFASVSLSEKLGKMKSFFDKGVGLHCLCEEEGNIPAEP